MNIKERNFGATKKELKSFELRREHSVNSELNNVISIDCRIDKNGDIFLFYDDFDARDMYHG